MKGIDEIRLAEQTRAIRKPHVHAEPVAAAESLDATTRCHRICRGHILSCRRRIQNGGIADPAGKVHIPALSSEVAPPRHRLTHAGGPDERVSPVSPGILEADPEGALRFSVERKRQEDSARYIEKLRNRFRAAGPREVVEDLPAICVNDFASGKSARQSRQLADAGNAPGL